MHKAQRLINHVALVLDGSASMRIHKSTLVKVADQQIRHLATRSEELSQETRVSVYLFNNRIECLIFDMDVMRLPSISDLYSTAGMTALIDATLKSQEDLATTSQIYGDHAFLTFVLTDGQENSSTNPWTTLSRKLQNAQENWTLGFLVPDAQGKAYAERIGVSSGNIAIWDTTSSEGLTSSFGKIQSATDNFMAARATGVRGTRNVFSTGVDAVNKQTVANLVPLTNGQYNIFKVSERAPIKEVFSDLNIPFSVGKGYYQLTKTETIQANKRLVVVDKKNGKAYAGVEARQIVGLPSDRAVRVKPDYNPDYDIFVQSTSNNRVLVPNTRLLVI